MRTNGNSKPWYKHLWPWLIMLPPFAAVVGGVVTLILAGGPPDRVDVVVDERVPAVQTQSAGAGAGRDD